MARCTTLVIDDKHMKVWLGLLYVNTTVSQTKGKVERLIKTLLEKWVDGITHQTSGERWLPRYLGIYNGAIRVARLSVAFLQGVHQATVEF